MPTNSPNVVGLGMNEFTPPSYVRAMSSSARDVLSTTTGIWRRFGSLLISRRASCPFFLGMIKSSKTMFGKSSS